MAIRREFQLTDSRSVGELRMTGRMPSNQPLIHWFVFKQCQNKTKIQAEFTGIQAHLKASRGDIVCILIFELGHGEVSIHDLQQRKD